MRHLAVFVKSVHFHSTKEDAKQIQPRILLFGVLSGIVEYSTERPIYNTRVAPEYFFPSLRAVFPDPRKIERVLVLKTDSKTRAAVPRLVLEKGCIPLSLLVVLGGPFSTARFKRCLLELSDDKGSTVPFDKAMMLALDMWMYVTSWFLFHVC
jgi:hypothetical protein